MSRLRPGFTFVELSLAVSLTLILALTLPPLLTTAANSYGVSANRARLTHDVQRAMIRMTREIFQADPALFALAQPTRFTFTSQEGGPADYGFVANGSRGTLYRTAIPVLQNVNGVAFTYYDANDQITNTLANIRRIAIQITANATNVGTVTLQTEVFPRRFVYTNFQ